MWREKKKSITDTWAAHCPRKYCSTSPVSLTLATRNNHRLYCRTLHLFTLLPLDSQVPTLQNITLKNNFSSFQTKGNNKSLWALLLWHDVRKKTYMHFTAHVPPDSWKPCTLTGTNPPPSFPYRRYHPMQRVKDLLAALEKEEQGGQHFSDSCVPDRQWMARVHLDAAALDQHDVYIFTSQWVPSIPPSPWWPAVTASPRTTASVWLSSICLYQFC